MKLGDSYFFVNYGGLIEVKEAVGHPKQVTYPRQLNDDTWEACTYFRHDIKGMLQGMTYYFYADKRLTVDMALDMLLIPQHHERQIEKQTKLLKAACEKFSDCPYGCAEMILEEVTGTR